jgi:hypothetical protein
LPLQWTGDYRPLAVWLSTIDHRLSTIVLLAVGCWLWTFVYRLFGCLAMDHRPSTIDLWLFAMNHRPSTIDFSAVGYGPSTIDYRPFGCWPWTIDHRPSTIVLLAVGYGPSTIDFSAVWLWTIDHRLSTIDYRLFESKTQRPEAKYIFQLRAFMLNLFLHRSGRGVLE